MNKSDEGLTCGNCVQALKENGVSLAVLCPFLQEWRALCQTCPLEVKKSIDALFIGGVKNG
jgi:hypothetical protein